MHDDTAKNDSDSVKSNSGTEHETHHDNDNDSENNNANTSNSTMLDLPLFIEIMKQLAYKGNVYLGELYILDP